MNYNAKENLNAYLGSRNLMTLATVTPDGKPVAHTVDFVHDADTVYFVTDKSTRKAQNILNNPNVFLAVDEEINDISECRAVQMAGLASLVTDAGEAQKTLGMLVSKIPMMAKLPPNPNMSVFKIKLTKGHFIDNTFQLGFRAEIEF